MSIESVLEAIRPYLPHLLAVLPFLAGVIALAAQHRLDDFARETVAAVYRVAIHAANELQDEGLTWLRSEAGIAYRKELAGRAYDLLPERIGVVPVGLVKLVISREAFQNLVEGAFQEMAKLADRLELPEELPVR